MNSDFPERTCEISRLVTHPKMVASVIAGSKVQQRRNGLYAYPDEVFELEGIPFVIISVEMKRLGDMTEADAQAEGYPTLGAYKQLILKMHAGMSWNDEDQVWVHTFKRTVS